MAWLLIGSLRHEGYAIEPIVDGLAGHTYYVPSGNGEESGDGSRDG